MRFKVNASELASGLGIVNQTIPSRASRPVLQNVCLSANGGLELMGTDMEIGIRHKLPAHIEMDGDVCLPAARLQAIVRNIGNGEIHATNGDLTVELRADRKYFKLVGDEPADFPCIPTFPEVWDFSLDGQDLRHLYQHTAYAAAREETRYAIHGLLFKAEGRQMDVCATDGKRLALDKCILPVSSDVEFLINPKAIKYLLKLIPKPKKRGKVDFGSVDVSVDEKRVLFRYVDPTCGQETVIVASIIDGTFPTYEEVIPKGCKARAEIHADDLADAVQSAGLMASEGSNAIWLKVAPGTLSIGARASNVGEAEVDFPIDYDGDASEIHFNPKYILDFLKSTDADTITVDYNDARSAVKFTDGTGYTYIVMPVTLESVD